MRYVLIAKPDKQSARILFMLICQRGFWRKQDANNQYAE